VKDVGLTSPSTGSAATHPLLDPSSSGRVVIDYALKLVTTALEMFAQLMS